MLHYALAHIHGLFGGVLFPGYHLTQEGLSMQRVCGEHIVSERLVLFLEITYILLHYVLDIISIMI